MKNPRKEGLQVVPVSHDDKLNRSERFNERIKFTSHTTPTVHKNATSDTREATP
jgi:hypothetical protein